MNIAAIVRFSWKAMWMSNKGKMKYWAVMFIPNPIAMFVIDSSREWVLDCIDSFLSYLIIRFIQLNSYEVSVKLLRHLASRTTSHKTIQHCISFVTPRDDVVVG